MPEWSAGRATAGGPKEERGGACGEARTQPRGEDRGLGRCGEATRPALPGCGLVLHREGAGYLLAEKGAEPLSSKHARGAKAEVPQAGWIAFAATKDDVIQQFDVDGLRCLTKHSRDVQVGSARRRIAARVIVSADDT
jgi:hypothetical protein